MFFDSLKFSLFILAMLILANSCSKDDDKPSCTQENWLGSYTATSDCDPDRIDILDFVITAGADANELIFTDSEGDSFNITPSGCEVLEFTIFTISASGELNGNTLTWYVTDNDPRDMYSCTITYKK